MTAFNGSGLSCESLASYLKTLVNLLFKILPMREKDEATLPLYLESLSNEVSGCTELFELVDHDAGLVRILGIIRYLAANPDCSVETVRREVFQAIRLCDQLRERHAEAET